METDTSALDRHNEAQRAYYRSGLHAAILPAETPYVIRHLDEVLADAAVHAGDRVLDMGCGMGRHTLPMARRGLRVEALDLSPELLERLRQCDGGLGIPTHCADMADPPPELARRFRAVVGFFILHHVPDLTASFRGVARVLEPGGRAVFIEPNPRNPLYYLQIACTPGTRWSAEKGMLRLRLRPAIVRAVVESAGLAWRGERRLGFLPPFARNTFWGGGLEHGLEMIGPLRPLSAFQIFRAVKPTA